LDERLDAFINQSLWTIWNSINHANKKTFTRKREDFEWYNLQKFFNFDILDQLRQLKEKHQKQISKLTLWSSPITTIKLCFLEIFAILRRFLKSMQRHFFITFFVITIIVAFITLKYMSLTHHMVCLKFN